MYSTFEESYWEIEKQICKLAAGRLQRRKIISVACTIICLRALSRLFDIRITCIITHTHTNFMRMRSHVFRRDIQGGYVGLKLSPGDPVSILLKQINKDWQSHLEPARNLNERNKVSFEHDTQLCAVSPCGLWLATCRPLPLWTELQHLEMQQNGDNSCSILNFDLRACLLTFVPHKNKGGQQWPIAIQLPNQL